MPHAYDSPDRVASYDADMDIMHPNRPRMVRAAIGFLPFAADEPMAVLDLGIGTGYFARQLLEAFPRARLIGIDVAPAMLASARTRLRDMEDRVDLRVGDVRELRGAVSVWERGQAVISSYALHHLSRWDKTDTLRQARQFLEPGGWLLNADLIVADGPEMEARIQALRVDGIVQRAGWRDERFADAVRTRAFLDELEARDGDQPQTLEVELAVLREAGFEEVGPIWIDHREAVTVGLRR